MNPLFQRCVMTSDYANANWLILIFMSSKEDLLNTHGDISISEISLPRHAEQCSFCVFVSILNPAAVSD